MKKYFYLSILASSLLLTACGSEEDIESSNTGEEVATEQTESQTTEDTENNNSEAQEDQEPQENEEKETTPAEPQYAMDPSNFFIHSLDPENEEELVLLTYDDAPYGNSLEIADILEERDANAIFFVNGMYLEDEEGAATLKELHDRGFVIGNHTYTHATLPDYDTATQREEIVKTSDKIEEITGERPRFFRAPHGMMTDYSEEVVAEEGMMWMNWSFGYDWQPEYQDPAALADVTLNGGLLADGANILMHDREWTAQATPTIVDGLLERDFTIVDPNLLSTEPLESEETN